MHFFLYLWLSKDFTICRKNHYPMSVRLITILCLSLLSKGLTRAQNLPDFLPYAEYTTSTSKSNPDPKTLTVSYPGMLSLTEVQNAPLEGRFSAGGVDTDGWNVSYFWEIELDTAMNGAFESVRRAYDADIDYVFSNKGLYRIRFTASCTKGNSTIVFPAEGQDAAIFTLQISDSRLTFPNAFSPNGDGQNDYLRPIEYQSIVEFHAAVFNRWGQRVYAWDDVTSDGWDGRIGGKWAKDGAYYLVCNAKGADGTRYRIKKTITVLTSYNSNYSEDFNE